MTDTISRIPPPREGGEGKTHQEDVVVIEMNRDRELWGNEPNKLNPLLAIHSL